MSLSQKLSYINHYHMLQGKTIKGSKKIILLQHIWHILILKITYDL